MVCVTLGKRSKLAGEKLFSATTESLRFSIFLEKYWLIIAKPQANEERKIFLISWETLFNPIGQQYGIHRNLVSKINKGQAYVIKNFSYPAR